MKRTDFGIFTEAVLAHPLKLALKVDRPMKVTEFGISTDTRLVQPAKAYVLFDSGDRVRDPHRHQTGAVLEGVLSDGDRHLGLCVGVDQTICVTP